MLGIERKNFSRDESGLSRKKHSRNCLDTLLTVLSVWRPSGDPIESHPLAVMDGSTVTDEKLVEVDVVRHSYIGESYYPLQHDAYKWYFINNQTKEDVLLFKMYDSAEGVRAKCEANLASACGRI